MPDAARFVGTQPDRFLRSGFEAYMRRFHELPKGATAPAWLSEFAEVWGAPPPSPLRALSRFTQTAKGCGRVHEYVPELAPPSLPSTGKNLVEELILADQDDYLGLSFVAPLAGAVAIGRAGNGDLWFLGLYDHLFGTPKSEGHVYPFDHEESALGEPISSNLSAFVFLNAICEARDNGALDDASFAEVYRGLKRRVNPTWQFAAHEALALEKRDRKKFRFDPGAAASRYLFFRSLWIRYLLKNDGVVTVEDIPAYFAPSVNEPITPEVWQRWMSGVDGVVPTALYVLFRCFFFDDRPRLAEAIDRCAKSRSRLIRDGAALVSELSRGRASLGSIRDVGRLGEALRALDLDPARGQERRRELAAKSRMGAETARIARKNAERAIAKGEDLDVLAWNKLDDAAAHETVWKALRDDPSMGATLRMTDYVDTDAHVHDNLVLEHERTEALLALSELADRRIVPLLVGRALREDKKAIDMLGALGDARAIPHLLALLERKPQRYRHLETSVVSALRALGAREAAPRLAELLSHNPLGDWKEGLERGQLVRELTIALGELGGPAQASALLAVLLSRSQEYKEILPLAALALAKLGSADAVVPVLSLVIASKDAIAAEYFWALGELGVKLSSQRREIAALLAKREGLDPAAEVVRRAALVKLGGDRAPFEAALRCALDEPGYKRDETSRRRAWAWVSFGEVGGVRFDDDTIRRFVTMDDHRVRRAAVSALARQARPAPAARPYFLFTTLDLFEKKGVSALNEAVRDPLGVFRYNVALKLAQIRDPSSVGPLIEATASLLAEPAVSTYEYDDAPHHLVWFVKALKRFDDPEGNAVLVGGLLGNNHHVRAVIADDPPKDERAVAALVRMLEDPRSFLRSRAERALVTLRGPS